MGIFVFLTYYFVQFRYIRSMKNAIELLKSVLSPLYEAGEVKAITQLLLEEVCGLSRTQQLLYRDELKLSNTQHEQLSVFAQKLAQGIPVQQVLGYEYFRGRKFVVTSDVLIPRPETAELVNMIVDKHVHKDVDNTLDNSVHKFLDIGTGSGCIALSLAADINNSHVVAIDLSTEALIIAKQNAKLLKISNIEFIQMDILNPSYEQLSTYLSTAYQPPFDVIVSNPPYICMRESAEMSARVLEHEPHLALFVPDVDPLLFYRAIARFGQTQLKQGGMLYFEINTAYGPETCELLKQLGYQQVALFADSDGRNRFVSAVWN